MIDHYITGGYDISKDSPSSWWDAPRQVRRMWVSGIDARRVFLRGVQPTQWQWPGPPG